MPPRRKEQSHPKPETIATQWRALDKYGSRQFDGAQFWFLTEMTVLMEMRDNSIDAARAEPTPTSVHVSSVAVTLW
jgi:hypothetical protein